jgi:hypothetical protein
LNDCERVDAFELPELIKIIRSVPPRVDYRQCEVQHPLLSQLIRSDPPRVDYRQCEVQHPLLSQNIIEHGAVVRIKPSPPYSQSTQTSQQRNNANFCPLSLSKLTLLSIFIAESVFLSAVNTFNPTSPSSYIYYPRTQSKSMRLTLSQQTNTHEPLTDNKLFHRIRMNTKANPKNTNPNQFGPKKPPGESKQCHFRKNSESQNSAIWWQKRFCVYIYIQNIFIRSQIN